MTARPCWCGAGALVPFSPDYQRCTACGTLVSQVGLTEEQTLVRDDDQDFYGKQYWLTHQRDELGYPDIHRRAATELNERCLHWLRTALKYKLPPAKSLELGSAHGGFVALMHWAGYDATGLELSPWVAEFARQTFDVPMLVGPVEGQQIERASLDVIALMDVLEHLPDPVGTIQHCLDLLKPDGVLIIQTPRTPAGETYEKMVAEDSPFLALLTSDEHLYLFSTSAIKELFHRLGVEHIQFEPAIFAHYDMFLVVGKMPLQPCSDDQINEALLVSPQARMVHALLDTGAQREECQARLSESEADRAARLEIINHLGQQLDASEADRAARLEVIQRQEAELRKRRIAWTALLQWLRIGSR